MSTMEESHAPPAGTDPPGSAWRRVAVRGAFAIPVVFILLMLVSMEVVPILVVFCAVFAALGFWASRGGRASVIVLGVISVIFIVTNLPFVIATLSIPASPVDFISNAWVLLAAVTIAVAAFMAARGNDSPSGAGTWSKVVVGVGVVAVAVSLISFLTYEDDTKQEGDIEIATAEFRFQPESIEVDGGTVGVFISNEDPATHTFTIEELDVDVVIPQGASVRVEFDAEPGEYEVVCTPHEEGGMTGTLEVR